jgi:hypothetical protein
MLCPWALGFSAGAPFLGGISLGFIGRKSMRRPFINEKVRPKSEEKALFQQKLCCHTVEERIRLKEKRKWALRMAIRNDQPVVRYTNLSTRLRKTIKDLAPND